MNLRGSVKYTCHLCGTSQQSGSVVNLCGVWTCVGLFVEWPVVILCGSVVCIVASGSVVNFVGLYSTCVGL